MKTTGHPYLQTNFYKGYPIRSFRKANFISNGNNELVLRLCIKEYFSQVTSVHNTLDEHDVRYIDMIAILSERAYSLINSEKPIANDKEWQKEVTEQYKSVNFEVSKYQGKLKLKSLFPGKREKLVTHT